MKIEISVAQFEVLEDVLSEIQVSRDYEGDWLEVLEGLKEVFSYQNYRKYRDRL